MTARVSIGLLVNPAMEKRLRDAVPFVPYTMLADWVELAFFDLEASPSAFIVDPTMLPDESRDRTLRQLGARSRAAVILYAHMTHHLAAILLDAGRIKGIRHVMLFGVDDTPKGVRSLLAHVLERRFSDQTDA